MSRACDFSCVAPAICRSARLRHPLMSSLQCIASKPLTFRSRERDFSNRYGKSRLPYDFGYVTIPHGSLNPSIVRTGLYEFASTTITLLDRPQANRICESSGVNVKCQHLCPIGISAISCIESAENTRAFGPLRQRQRFACRRGQKPPRKVWLRLLLT